MKLSAIIAVLCVLCTPVLARTPDANASKECFASKQQAWGVYPGQHLYHHQTPNGMCYHIGTKNRSGVFTSTKASPSKVGSGIVVKAKPVPHFEEGFQWEDFQTKMWERANPWLPKVLRLGGH